MTSAKEVEIQGLPKNMILGENNRPAFVNTDSACLDLFFSAVPGTDVEEVQKMLESAWNENPQLALRIIFNLGNVRGGKQDRVNYYRALSWLYERYPSTFLLNLKGNTKALLPEVLAQSSHVLHSSRLGPLWTGGVHPIP